MKKSILFIDRDGTIIVEPPDDFQVDSIEKLKFLDNVVESLQEILEIHPYELVMVTNQDGLGTDSFPEETFWPAHNKMMDHLTTNNIHFKEVLIDRTFEHENAPTRKPNIGLCTHYLNDDTYDLSSSFVLGDRLTDIQLAKNLGCQGILIKDSSEDLDKEIEEKGLTNATSLVNPNWIEITQFFMQLHSNL